MEILKQQHVYTCRSGYIRNWLLICNKLVKKLIDLFYLLENTKMCVRFRLREYLRLILFYRVLMTPLFAELC